LKDQNVGAIHSFCSIKAEADRCDSCEGDNGIL